MGQQGFAVYHSWTSEPDISRAVGLSAGSRMLFLNKNLEFPCFQHTGSHIALNASETWMRSKRMNNLGERCRAHFAKAIFSKALHSNAQTYLLTKDFIVDR